MTPCYELQHFYLMYPQAEVRQGGFQLYWETNDGENQHSITFYFFPEDLDKAKFMAEGCNDVMFLGNYRFASTYTPN